MGNRYILSTKLLEIETAKTLNTADGFYDDLDALVDDIFSLATILAGAPGALERLHIDELNRDIYWLDGLAVYKSPLGLSLNGTIVHSRISNMAIVALDTKGGAICWVENINEIYYGPLVSSPAGPVTTAATAVTSIDFDPFTGTIYWSESIVPTGIEIISIRTDKTGSNQVVSEPITEGILDICLDLWP